MKPLSIAEAKDFILFCKANGVRVVNYENLEVMFKDSEIPVGNNNDFTSPEEPDFGFIRNLKPVDPMEDE